MPQISGRELAAQVVALRPAIKVVFMSGYPGGITSERGMFDPNAFLLQKPFGMDALWHVLRQVLGSDKSDVKRIQRQTGNSCLMDGRNCTCARVPRSFSMCSHTFCFGPKSAHRMPVESQ